MSSPHPSSTVLALQSPEATLERVGGKGASLARLAAAGLPVPPGFHVTTDAYRRFVQANDLGEAILSAAALAKADDPATLDQAAERIGALFAQGTIPEDIAAAIPQSYADLGEESPPVAVRSSATAEDLPEMSFAGQQETFLNVRGAEAVLEAVRRCWASLWTARGIGYRLRQDIRPEDVSLAVVVQQLVAAEVAGMLFTANPLTGARDEMMINAAWGLGEAIVGGLVTPDTLIVNSETGALVSQEVADKEVMTVRSPEGTHEVPVPTEKRRQAALRPLQAAELARLGGRIAQLYGQPMDIEWAIADERLFILQARPITALPEPPAVLDWTLPRPGGRYARGSVIELLPDPLSPLFETLGLPLWNAAMGRLAQAIGFQAVLSEQMLTTINDYAYYDWAMSGSQAIRVIGAFVTGLPRFYRLLGSAQTRWTDGARPEYEQVVRSWSERDLGTAPARELLEGAQAIVKAAADHYLTVQSGILPVAYMSEAAFTSLYRRLAQRANDPPALTFMLGFDSEPIRAEKSLYDLAAWARSQPALADYLSRTGGTEIVAVFRSPAAPIADAAGWQEFARRFARHLDRFGHAVYDLDFAKNVPADDPAPLLETLKYFLGGSARSPYERQQTAAADREQATEALLRRLRGLRLRLFRPLLGTAQRYAPLREDALADAGLGWPQLRRMLHEVGRRLVEVGAMADEDDVFWFEWDELQALGVALDAGQPMPDSRDLIAERRAIWARERVVTPPVTLPLDGGARWLGIDWSRFMPARSDQAPGDTITGIGASPGRIEGTARVIHGPEAFGQMRPGDILVAKITTPAWTPLFALAAGIVTDVGGPLSHSSIVAREYHIPAVLGTGVATARIRSGQRITVDGDRGAVTVGVQ